MSSLKKQAVDYVKYCIESGHYPSYHEIDAKFHIRYLKLTMKQIYSQLDVCFLNLPRRPAACSSLLKKPLLNYVQLEVKENHFPSRRELERKFKVDIGKLFGGIDQLYFALGIKYKQQNSQTLKKDKANILTEIVVAILPKLHLVLLHAQKAHKRGVDILAKNAKSELIGIELKAYNQFEPLKQKHIVQLSKYIKKYSLKRGLLITTASKTDKLKVPTTIQIFLFDDLKKLCESDKSLQSQLKYIRDKSIHVQTHEYEVKKQRILNYIRANSSAGKYVGARDILQDLGLCLYTYFKNVDEIYQKTNALPSLNKIRYVQNKQHKAKLRKKMKNQILTYMREQVKKKHYPSGIDVGNNFGIKHIWNYFKMSDLYKELNLPTYLERKIRKF